MKLKYIQSTFDIRTDTCVVGAVSQFAGEEVLIGLAQHSLAAKGEPTRRADFRPIRDDAAMAAGGLREPGVRDLDAWLLGDRYHYPLEAKCRTAASLHGKTVTEERIGEQARANLADVISNLRWPRWNTVNKVLLPLRSPVNDEDGRPLRRVLAMWHPCSDSADPWSVVADCETLDRHGRWIAAEVEIFSGSLYVRNLIAAGVTTIDFYSAHLESALARLRDMFSGTNVT